MSVFAASSKTNPANFTKAYVWSSMKNCQSKKTKQFRWCRKCSAWKDQQKEFASENKKIVARDQDCILISHSAHNSNDNNVELMYKTKNAGSNKKQPTLNTNSGSKLSACYWKRDPWLGGGGGVWKFGAQFCKDGVAIWSNKRIWILVNTRTFQKIYM